MTRRKRYAALAVLATTAVAGGILAGASAGPSEPPVLTNVATANTRSDGYAPWSKLSVELRQVVVAQGSTKLDGGSVSPSSVGYYGYDNDLLNAAGQPQMVPTPTTPSEAKKTEPDKNTYLVFKNSLPGADPHYWYGTHFLFQGHELGSPGYITRINLDADADHRVTLLATKDVTGANLATIDGSTWDPWAQRLLFTTESSGAPTYSATPGYPSTVTDVSGALGRGGYEGIQNDSDGNLWIAEDIGGASKPGTTARIPNSFIYRYVPKTKGDLANGKLQVLQVLNAAGDPITKLSQTPLNSPDQVALHTYGTSFKTQWVTIHDTAVDGSAPFVANPLAVAKNGTPFKRPENGVFRPAAGFKEFYFDETGDTNATSPENPIGGWTGVFKLRQKDPSADTGTLSLFYKGDAAHAGFDNVTFISRDQITFVEDAGDTLHGQRNALDSGFVFNVETNYASPSNQPIRWLAEGRDPSATLDAANGGFGKNEGDNEITGAIVSNGDPDADGILGAKPPKPFKAGWRWFYTQQHGDNPTYEVIPAEGDGPEGP
ncbi:MAG TPA: hypothetical protein VLK24_11945 [Gaiellaceae bacterium]|nr:hypothetical protein [Gaiellaceae bacterium]